MSQVATASPALSLDEIRAWLRYYRIPHAEVARAAGHERSMVTLVLLGRRRSPRIVQTAMDLLAERGHQHEASRPAIPTSKRPRSLRRRRPQPRPAPGASGAAPAAVR